MCLTPLLIKNPYYKSRVIGYNSPDRTCNKTYSDFAREHYKDYINPYIYVPCGHCSQCIANKESNIIQRVEMHCEFHHAFMITLTYDDKHLRHFLTSTGRDIVYADYGDIQNMFKRIRVHNLIEREFSYMVVSELGSKRGRPHFHMIVFVRKYKSDDYKTIKQLESKLWKVFFQSWKRRTGGSDKKPIYEPLFTYRKKFVGGKLYSNYDCHFVDDNTSKNNGKCDVIFYLYKYLYKRSAREVSLLNSLRSELPFDEYRSTCRIISSSWRSSKGIGIPLITDKSDDFDREYFSFVETKIKSFIKLSVLDKSAKFPQFFSKFQKTYPLGSFYRNRFISLDDLSVFARRNGFDDESISFQLRQSDYDRKFKSEQFRRTFEKMDISSFDEIFYDTGVSDVALLDNSTFIDFSDNLTSNDIEAFLGFDKSKCGYYDGPCGEKLQIKPLDYWKSLDRLSQWYLMRRFYDYAYELFAPFDPKHPEKDHLTDLPF